MDEAFIIQSHRGAGRLSSDNTLEAFELGWSLGTIPETDMRTTRDGVIVGFHDKTLERVVRSASPELAARSVAEVSWEELKNLDVGSWMDPTFAHHRVPRLADIFAVMRGRRERQLYLDIKEVDLQKLAELVKEFGVNDQVLFASSDYSLIRSWGSLVPGARTLLWMGTWGKDDDTLLEAKFTDLRARNFQYVTQVQIHAHLKLPLEEIHRKTVDPFMPSDAFFRAAARELAERGVLLQSLPWGGGTEEVYWKLLDLGVRSFASDHPEVTLRAIQRYKPLAIN